MMRNPQAVVEVAYDCLQNMLETEMQHTASANCLAR
jgi:hypothetical protein